MSENTNDFSVAKVGDRVWVRLETYEGLADIVFISDDPKSVYPIMVLYPIGRTAIFSTHGRAHTYGPQCLFWAEPTIIAPPRPKRLVKKMVEIVPCLYDGDSKQYLKRVDTIASSHYRPNGPVQTVEVEVEE